MATFVNLTVQASKARISVIIENVLYLEESTISVGTIINFVGDPDRWIKVSESMDEILALFPKVR